MSTNIWETAGKVEAKTYNPTITLTTEEPHLIGVLKAVNDVKGTHGVSKKYVFEIADGSEVEIWGSTALDQRFKEGGEKGEFEPLLPALVGRIVKVSFKGNKDPKDDKSLRLYDVISLEDTEENRRAVFSNEKAQVAQATAVAAQHTDIDEI